MNLVNYGIDQTKLRHYQYNNNYESFIDWIVKYTNTNTNEVAVLKNVPNTIEDKAMIKVYKKLLLNDVRLSLQGRGTRSHLMHGNARQSLRMEDSERFSIHARQTT